MSGVKPTDSWRPPDPEDRVWNRAALDDGGPQPRPGDRALADLLIVHGRAMNGGVVHAVERLTETEVAAAVAGYRFFGLEAAAMVLVDVADALGTDGSEAMPPDDAVDLEQTADRRYYDVVPTDNVLVEAFYDVYVKHPDWFAPA